MVNFVKTKGKAGDTLKRRMEQLINGRFEYEVPALVLSGGALLVALGVLAPQVYCVLLFAALGTVLWSLWQLGRSSCRAAA